MSSQTAKKKNKKKKAPKKQEVVTDEQEIAVVETKDEEPTEDEEQASILAALDPIGETKSKENVLKAAFSQMQVDEQRTDHKFWNTQPVPDYKDGAPREDEIGAIDLKTVDQVKKDPYPLPANFVWAECDMSDPKMVDEVYHLLAENYVEDDDNMFRFDYSREFLMWALMPPEYNKQLHVCVRVATGKKKLVGFITGIPASIAAYQKTIPMVEINFLCVHKRLRSKRLAPVLIKEITRRVNLGDVWQAVYTAGVVIPKPVARNRYYHRSLNPKKLIEIGFSRLQARMTLSRTIKLYKVPGSTQVPGMRQMEKRDVPQTTKLLATYLEKFSLHQNFNEEEFEHAFLTRENVVYTFVVEDPATKQITDMISFYSLPSSIIGHDKYNTLRAAYSFYNVQTKTSWNDLMNDALILAKQRNFDVFNALNVMDNDVFLTDLKFGIGDGNLQYYLYNWRCPEMQPKDVGLVLL